MVYKEIITKHEATEEFPEWIEVWAIVELSQWDMQNLHMILWQVHNAPDYNLYWEIDDTFIKYNIW